MTWRLASSGLLTKRGHHPELAVSARLGVSQLQRGDVVQALRHAPQEVRAGRRPLRLPGEREGGEEARAEREEMTDVVYLALTLLGLATAAMLAVYSIWGRD